MYAAQGIRAADRGAEVVGPTDEARNPSAGATPDSAKSPGDRPADRDRFRQGRREVMSDAVVLITFGVGYVLCGLLVLGFSLSTKKPKLKLVPVSARDRAVKVRR